MSVETAADRAAMLDEWGVDATYTPQGGEATTVHGIFDNAYQGEDVGADAEVATSLPRFLGSEEDLADADEDDLLTVNGVNYIVRVAMPDGTGMVELAIEETD